jgi:two-component system sensor kinase FixL
MYRLRPISLPVFFAFSTVITMMGLVGLSAAAVGNHFGPQMLDQKMRTFFWLQAFVETGWLLSFAIGVVIFCCGRRNASDAITARKAAKARLGALAIDLAYMARLQAMEELSMALAHELNQPLATIMNHIAVVEHAIAKEAAIDHADIAKHLLAATDQAMRAGQIVKRLRTFDERAHPEKRSENVADLVSEAVVLISGTIHNKGMTIALAIEDRDAEILADRLQIQNVILNLVVNAVEAVENLSIVKPGIFITVRSTAQSTIEIIVEDDGPGISAEKRIALFDRFSTAPDRETGLGIPISLRILASHGGDLTYVDRICDGARLVLTLPRADPCR